MNLREAAEKALEALIWEAGYSAELYTHKTAEAVKALRSALAEAEEPDLSKCPNCGDPADNGHDRCIPPNPYHCTKCSAEEPVVWQYRTRPTWGRRHGLEDMPWGPWEFCSKETAEDYWRTPFLNDWAYEARVLYTHPPRREPLTVEAIDALTERVEFLFGFSDDWAVHFARAIERAHGIGESKSQDSLTKGATWER